MGGGKVATLFAMVLALTCFAACSSDETQDVYVTNLQKGQSGKSIGTVEGTITSPSTSSSYTYSYAFDSKRPATVQWTKSDDDPITKYDLKIPYTETEKSNSPDSIPSKFDKYMTFSLYEFQGKYYYSEDDIVNEDKKVNMEGSLKGTFTIQAFAFQGNDIIFNILNLKFTKK